MYVRCIHNDAAAKRIVIEAALGRNVNLEDYCVYIHEVLSFFARAVYNGCFMRRFLLCAHDCRGLFGYNRLHEKCALRDHDEVTFL